MVQGASHASAAASQDVSVDHRRADVFMPEKILNSSDVVSVFKQMCRKAVTEGMAGDALLYLRRTNGLLDRSL